VEACDRLHAFEVLRSMTGGMSSGFGSLLLQKLKDYFGDIVVAEFQMFPAILSCIDVYNQLMAMSHSIDYSGAVVLFDMNWIETKAKK